MTMIEWRWSIRKSVLTEQSVSGYLNVRTSNDIWLTQEAGAFTVARRPIASIRCIPGTNMNHIIREITLQMNQPNV